MPDLRVPSPVRTGVAVVVVLASLATTVLLHLRHPDALVTLVPLTDMRDLHVDFDTFWHSAAALTQGGDIYETPAKLTNLNPPLLTVLLAPFAALDALTAYRIFVGLTLLLVVGAVLAVARELRLAAGTTVAVVLAVLASSPLHGTLVLGQIYPLLLVGLVAGWLAERRGRPVLAAACVGITVALKPSLAPLLLLPAVQRRMVPLRAGLVSAAVATLVGVLVAGPSSAIQWMTIALTEGVPDTVDNASLPGLAMRLGVAPMLGFVAGLAVLVGTLAWLGRHRDRVDPAGTAPWAVVAAGLLFSPIAWHNYLLILVPGVLLLLAGGRRALAAALLAVAVIPVSWNAMWPPDAGWWTDVGQSLHCAILVAYWVSLLRSAVRSPQPPDGTADDPEPGVTTRPPSTSVSPTC
ncbi:glycosyltransferase family 87 protein [Pseudonocardia sp.]|uniref:glycosyltransferase family 87 protein n=1 Tax=Pseudonocardia sp. TaxID=60912 RepID=UPI00262760A1|nr:glycosyltransferase family 87 protein [Pseudonocardia sp.]